MENAPFVSDASRRWRICVIGSGLRLCEEAPGAAPIFLDTGLKDGNDARLLVRLLFSTANKRTYAECVSAMRTRNVLQNDDRPEPGDATQNVRKARERLEEKLKPFAARGFAPLIHYDGQCVALNRAAYTSDIERAELLYQAARHAAPQSPQAKQVCQAFLTFCGRGDLLSSWSDANGAIFLEPFRLRLAALRQEAFMWLAEIEETNRDYAAALRYAESALACHTAETAFTERARALTARIKRGPSNRFAPGTGALSPPRPVVTIIPAPAADTETVVLPFYGNSFRGRDEEIRALNALADTDAVRLVTLWGTGGIGKTRLLTEWAALWQKQQNSQAAENRRAIFLVHLAPLFDAAQVPSAMAEALGLTLVPGGDKGALIAARLRAAFRPIVLFDNAEHLLPPTLTDSAPTAETARPNKGPFREFLEKLLQNAPNATFFVTSRQALQMQAEHRLPIGPLVLPPSPTLPLASARTEEAQTQDLLRCSSVQIFVDRAKQIHAPFTANEETLPIIAQLVRLLDGLPLALELIAGNTTRYSVKSLLAQLNGDPHFQHFQRLRQLAARDLVDGDARHSSLWGAFSLSFHALTPRQQALWARLSVFRDGADLAAIRAVCLDSMEIDALGEDLLQKDLENFALRSLIQIRLSANEGEAFVTNQRHEADEPRFVLLETLRAFGWEALPSEARQAAAYRHAAYYLQIAESANRALYGPEVARGYAIMEVEYPNLRVALEFLIRESPASAAAHQDALRFVGALGAFWQMGNQEAEGYAFCERLWALKPSAQPAAEGADKTARLSALVTWLWLNVNAHHFDRAAALFEEGLHNAAEANPPDALTAELWRACGFAQMMQGDVRPARRSFETALHFARRGKGTAFQALALHALGSVAVFENDANAALEWYEKSLDLSRRTGYLRRAAVTLGALCGVALHQKRYDDALPLAAEALEMQQRVKNPNGVLLASRVLGEVFLCLGAADKARALFDTALQGARRGGAILEEGIVYRNLGRLALRQNDWTGALAAFSVGLRLVHQSNARIWTATLLCWCAIAIGAREQLKPCVVFWHAGTTLCDATDGGKLDLLLYEEIAVYLAQARQTLGEAVYAEAQKEGAETTVENALRQLEGFTREKTDP